ncbi:tol-pal system protein YbgF [Luteimonas sp. 50]|uniref:Cell division coordinator CpoB n=1 Tax=Cognatiluteimonas sedimenti TaxID=2927791 RepID=A0ABT0A490_9GAMM|nr:tol-pal system protein YbgF [Lysobacter sedimenti]MCJ0825798.1 tol-pal system protein YbgF [Lysobacter sedimenti]
MNTPRLPLLVGAHLLGALLLATVPPASAQRASLAERVAALEQQAANNQGNVDLLNQVTALKAEVQALRSQLEELQHQQQQWHDSSRNQYLDLDGRLNRLEGGGVAVPATPASANAAPPAAAAGSAERPPAVYGDPGLLAGAEGERAAYDAAFDVLKAGRYDESARLFQDFLQRYPNGAWTPNALYWLGESYYVTQNYAMAQQQFQSLLDRYPTHDKAPGALLKVGLSQYGLKQLDVAEATLARVVQLYPGTDAARTADDRLRAMQLNALR